MIGSAANSSEYNLLLPGCMLSTKFFTDLFFQNLTRAAFGKRILHDFYDPGIFVRRHPFFHIIPNIVRVEFDAFFQGHPCGRLFAEIFVRKADYGNLQNLRDLIHDLFNLSWIYSDRPG